MSTDGLNGEETVLVTSEDVKAHDSSLPGINLKGSVLEQSSIDCLSKELRQKHFLESLGPLKISSATILILETKEIRGRYTTFLEVSYQIQDPHKNKTILSFRTNGYGRNVLSGLPVSVDISSDIIYQAIIDSLHSIMDAIKVILERTPPELAADIIKDGVYFTGGTSQINNLEKYIKDETNLNVNIVEHPAESVVRGLMGVVSNPEFAKVAYTPTEKNFD